MHMGSSPNPPIDTSCLELFSSSNKSLIILSRKGLDADSSRRTWRIRSWGQFRANSETCSK